MEVSEKYKFMKMFVGCVIIATLSLPHWEGNCVEKKSYHKSVDVCVLTLDFLDDLDMEDGLGLRYFI